MFVDVRIVDDAGRALPHDGRAQGELQCRGLHVVREYFRVHPPAPLAMDRCHTIVPALVHTSRACTPQGTHRCRTLGQSLMCKAALAAMCFRHHVHKRCVLHIAHGRRRCWLVACCQAEVHGVARSSVEPLPACLAVGPASATGSVVASTWGMAADQERQGRLRCRAWHDGLA